MKRRMPMSRYEQFKTSLEAVLRRARRPLTWTEIRAEAGFIQKVPHNRWVRRLEEESGLFRERAHGGDLYWSLDEVKRAAH